MFDDALSGLNMTFRNTSPAVRYLYLDPSITANSSYGSHFHKVQHFSQHGDDVLEVPGRKIFSNLKKVVINVMIVDNFYIPCTRSPRCF